MSLRPVVESLLQALEAGGGVGQAADLRAKFEARGWSALCKDDVDALLGLIERGVMAEPPGGADSHGQVKVEPFVLNPSPRAKPCSIPALATSDLPIDAWSPEQDFGAFLGGLPEGSSLLRACQRLAVADTFADAVAATREIFVDLLGLDSADLDEQARIGGETVREHRVVARYGQFAVSVVAYAYPWSWPTVAEPVFRLHPYGFVVGVAPGWNSVRLFVRLVRGTDAGQIRFRTLAGWSVGRDALDNLVLWAGRFAGLRPDFGDDEAALMERTQKRLLCDPADLALTWASTELDETQRVPGIAWSEIGSKGGAGFLQAGSTDERWFWGLQRVLIDRFPITIGPKKTGCAIRFIRYREHTADLPDMTKALATGRTWKRRLSLELEVEFPGGAAIPLRVPASVPRCTSDGRFVLDGRLVRFSPTVGDRGRLVSGLLDRIEEVDEDYLELLDEEELAAANNASGVFVPPLAEGDEEDGGGSVDPDADLIDEDGEAVPEWDGGSICSLLEVAVTRKLSAVVRQARRLPADCDPIVEFLNIVRRLSGDDAELLLTSKGFLRAALKPVRDTPAPEDRLTTIRSEKDIEPAFAPSWACLDVSARLPAGAWYPIESARLAPWAGLAVPTRRNGGGLRLGFDPDAGTQVNPRSGGEPRGALGWWIAEGLQELAASPVGTVPCAAKLISTGSRLHGFFGARVPSEELCVLVDRQHLAGLERTPIQIQRRLPANWPPNDPFDAVELMVSPGDVVDAGTVWLQAPKALWNRVDDEIPAALAERRLLAAVFAKQSRGRMREPDAKTWAWRLPAGVEGIVTQASLERVRLPGGIQVAWIARLELQAPALGASAVLPDGRVAAVRMMRREDVPYAAGDGDPATLVIRDPLAGTDWNDQVWFDGRTGDFVEGAELVNGPLWLLPIEAGAAIEGPDWASPRRVLDGAMIPAHPRTPALSAWERALWAAADPATFAGLASHERAWWGESAPWRAHFDLLRSALDLPEGRWRAGPRQVGEKNEPWDRVATGTRRRSVRYPKPWQVPWVFKCSCGAVKGQRQLHSRCEACSSLVIRRQRPRPPKLPFIELPAPVPHPWRAAALAALLGASLEEALGAYLAGGTQPLREAATLAAHEPLAAAEDRLGELEDRSERRDFARLLEPLNHEIELGLDVERLFVDRVPLLPPALSVAGMPARAPSMVVSDLARNYRRLADACTRFKRVGEGSSELLMELARFQLYEAVAGLYGESSGGGGTGTLAGLLRRLTPATRAAGLRQTSPGLFRRSGLSDEEAQIRLLSPPEVGPPDDGVRELEGRMALAGSSLVGLGVVTAQGIRPVPVPESSEISPASPAFWAEREARAEFFRRQLPLLATILGGLEAPSLSAVRPDPGQCAAAQLRGRLGTDWMALDAIRQLARAAIRGDAVLTPLVSQLASPLPRTLPEAATEARRVVSRLVEPAFPGSDELLKAARGVLCEVLVGWWTVAAGVSAPHGWSWLGAEGAGTDATSRRRLPPLSSAAWREWPGFVALQSPGRYLTVDSEQNPLSWHPWWRLVCGLPVKAVREGEAPVAVTPTTGRELDAHQHDPVPMAGSPTTVGHELESAESSDDAPESEPAPQETASRHDGVLSEPGDQSEVSDPVDVPWSAPPASPGTTLGDDVAAEATGEKRILRGALRAWLDDNIGEGPNG